MLRVRVADDADRPLRPQNAVIHTGGYPGLQLTLRASDGNCSLGLRKYRHTHPCIAWAPGILKQNTRVPDKNGHERELQCALIHQKTV